MWREIRNGVAAVQDRKLAGIGVDTWGVDYALLGERWELLQNPYHYRDRCTQGAMAEAFHKIHKGEIYALTGIQFLSFNTLYQLMATRRDTPQILSAAKCLVTMPDRFHYWLSFCHAIPGRWHVMGVTQAAGLSLRWFRDNFGPQGADDYELAAEAANAPAGSAGVLWGSLLNGRTHAASRSQCAWRPGRTYASHTRAHVVRAILKAGRSV